MSKPPSSADAISSFPLNAERLAAGATADIFSCPPGWVVKVFHAGFDLDYAEAEARSARAVFALAKMMNNFRVPAVGAIVRIDERVGVLYEYIEGGSMQEALLQTDPYPIAAFAQRLAELHTKVHAVHIDDVRVGSYLPLQTDRLRHAIESSDVLSTAMQDVVLQALTAIKKDDLRLCHGDFHMGNVLLTDTDEAVIIDWNDATRGCAIADVARTSLLIRYGVSPDAGQQDPATLSSEQLEAARQQFNRAYLDRYFELNPPPNPQESSQAILNRWLPIIAAARLSESVAESEKQCLCALIEASDIYTSAP